MGTSPRAETSRLAWRSVVLIAAFALAPKGDCDGVDSLLAAWGDQARQADAIPYRLSQRLSLRTWSSAGSLAHTGSAEVITDGTRYRISHQLGDRDSKETYTFDGKVWMSLSEVPGRAGVVRRYGNVFKDPARDIGTRLEDHIRLETESTFYVRLSDLLTVSHLLKRPLPEVMRRPGLRYRARTEGDQVVLTLEHGHGGQKEPFVSQAVLMLSGEAIALKSAECVYPGEGGSGNDLVAKLELGGHRPFAGTMVPGWLRLQAQSKAGSDQKHESRMEVEASPLVAPSDDLFRIEFPPGTRLNDYVSGRDRIVKRSASGFALVPVLAVAAVILAGVLAWFVVRRSGAP